MREPVTIVDVAKAAGVSPATVTHALNGKRPVGEATRKKVLEAIEQLGYVPSWSASRMKRGLRGSSAVLPADITETFVNQLCVVLSNGLSGDSTHCSSFRH